MKNPRAVPKTLGHAFRTGFYEAGAINLSDSRTDINQLKAIDEILGKSAAAARSGRDDKAVIGTMEMAHPSATGMLLVPFKLQLHFGRPYRERVRRAAV
jgi:hypothetical protein